MTNYQRFKLSSVLLVVFISSIAFFLLRPALTLKARTEIFATAIEVTAITSSFMIARAIASILVGALSDRKRGVRFFVVKYLFLPISAIIAAYTLAQNSITIIGLSSIHGFLAGFLWPTMQTIVGLSSSRRGLFMGIYFALASVGSSIGYFLYGVLPLSNNQLILVSSLLYLISFILIFSAFKLKTTDVMSSHYRVENRNSPKLPLWILCISFLMGCALGLMNGYVYLFLYEIANLSKTQLGLTLTLSAIFGIFGILCSGALADKIGVKNMLRILLVFSSLGLFMLAVFREPLLVVVALSAITIAIKATFPLTRNVIVLKDLSAAGTYIGLSNTLSNIGSFSYPLIAGFIYDKFSNTLIAGVDGRGFPLVVLALFMVIAISISFKRR